MREVKDRFNPDVQNGAFLLGVNGPVTIAHGSSSPTAIKNAVLYTANNLNEAIQEIGWYSWKTIQRSLKKI